MQSVSELPFPGSRALAQWWRQLQPFRPGAVWVGYVPLHRLEATVVTTQNRRVEPLVQLLLAALSLEPAASPCCGAGECLHRLQERLHLPSAALRQVLLGLQQDGLAQQHAPECWTITERGKQVLAHQEYPVEQRERRVLTFLERIDDQGRRLLPPHFAPVAECTGIPWQVQEAEQFDPALLEESIRQPPSWKQEFVFPAEIERLERPAGAGSAAWRQVIVARPELTFLVLVLPSTVERTPSLLGFVAAPANWALAEKTPVLRLPFAAAQILWPALRLEPESALQREAWGSWCRERSVSPPEAEACALGYQPGRLEVRAPERLLHRLRSARSDIFRGESWLLLGEGYLRPAVVLQMHSRARADAESR